MYSVVLVYFTQMGENHNGEFYHKRSELFESETLLEEVSDVLCIAQAGESIVTDHFLYD